MELNKTLQEIHAEATKHGVTTVFIPTDDFTRYQGKSRTHCGHDDTGDMIEFNGVFIRPCDAPPYTEMPKAFSWVRQEAVVTADKPVVDYRYGHGGVTAEYNIPEYMPKEDALPQAEPNLQTNRNFDSPEFGNGPKLKHKGKKK
jgi:hypothetical protein